MSFLRKISLGLLVSLASFTPALAAPPQPQAERVLEPFNYQGVSVDGGILKNQLDQVRAYYLAIPNDDLLKGFRKRAGFPAPGRDLGGWYGRDVFHVFGQIVSGLSRLYASTGDPAFRDKANYLVTEWGKCIDADGYFFFSKTPFARHYIYDKMLWGLIDNYLYCGNAEATNHMSKISDWALKNLDRECKVDDTAKEWYTLSENLYRAWLATGDPKYREFAQVWEYPAYWDFFARKADIFSVRPDGTRTQKYHAYSHVNTLGGAGTAYLVKGESRYLQILTNAFDYIQQNQVFATGGFGPDERFVPRKELLQKLESTGRSFETQCSTWAVFKMCKYLISFTGDARYGDWMERLAINGIGASIPMSPEGNVFYYADYNLHGACKANHEVEWTCCTGTRPQAVADFHDIIYFKSPEHLCVNLYTPSTVNWQYKGHTVKVTQSTGFPEEQRVEFQLGLAAPAQFQLKFRVPGWLAGPMRATVNGKKVSLKQDALHWAVLDRKWSNNDKIVLQLPMKLWASPLDPAQPRPAALLFGPSVLAFQSTNLPALREFPFQKLDRSLSPVSGQPLHYTLAGDPQTRIRPFYSIPAKEPYFVYLAPQMGSIVPHARFIYQGKWGVPGPHHVSNEPGSTLKYEFEGRGIRWLGNRFDDAGRGEVTIDGKIYCVVDQYGPGRNLPFEWTCKGLAPGRHTIVIKVLEEKTPASSNRYLNISGFEVLP